MPFRSAADLIALPRLEAIAATPRADFVALQIARLDEEHGARYVRDLWAAPLQGGAEAVPLTRGAHDDRCPRFVGPSGSLLFLSDRAPSEGAKAKKRAQVWRLEGRGEARRVSDEPLGVEGLWAARGAEVFVVSAPRVDQIADEKLRAWKSERDERGSSSRFYQSMPPRRWDHWIDRPAPRLIVYREKSAPLDLTPECADRWRGVEAAIADDGSALCALRTIDDEVDRIPSTVVELFDLASGANRIVAEGPRAQYGCPVMSADGALIALTRWTRRRRRPPLYHCVVIEVATGRERALELPEGLQLEPACFSSDARSLYASAPWRGERPIWRVDLASKEVERVSAPGSGSYAALEAIGEGAIVGIRSSIVRPPYPFSLSPDFSTPVALAAPGAERAEAIGEGITIERATARSADGSQVPYLVVRESARDAPLPALVCVHGGPISEWSDVWHWRWSAALLARQGFLVALPNPRGSRGYGDDWIEKIWGNRWGEGCYEDVMAVAEELSARPDADVDKLAAIGGSFGGYMVNWIGARTDRFRCLVSHAGVAEFAIFGLTTDLPAWWTHMIGEPEETDLGRYAPLDHAQGWSSPVLFIHGERDYRVPIHQSLALFERLDALSVDARLLVFPDENHWILRPPNIIAWYEHVIAFLDEHLRASLA